MASNTTFNPSNASEFDKSKINKDAKGVSDTVPYGTSKDIDYTLTDDILMSGGHLLLVKNAVWGDTVDFKVVHPVAGVLLTFLTSWPINPDSTLQFLPLANYPAKMVTGLILRATYNSVGASTNVSVAIGYNFEKVLV